MGIFELCQGVTYVSASDTSQEDINEIESGECVARKAAILNCSSLTAASILIAFALLNEIKQKVQDGVFYMV